MSDFGFIRISIVSPKLHLANVSANLTEHIKLIRSLSKTNTQVICFPELSLTGYTCGDLFHQRHLIVAVQSALHELLSISAEYPNLVLLIGAPILHQGTLYNCAVIYNEGEIKGIVPKTYLPNYNEFKDKIYFQKCPDTTKQIQLVGFSKPIWFGRHLVFAAHNNPDFCFGVEICEDLWAPNPPSTDLALEGATLLFNLSASNELIGKKEYRTRLVQQQSERCLSAYCYVSSGLGESTMDLVFGGHGLVYENGELIGELPRFKLHSQHLTVEIDIERLVSERTRNTVWGDATSMIKKQVNRIPLSILPLDYNNDQLKRQIRQKPFIPFSPNSKLLNERCLDIMTMQANGLAMRMQRSNSNTLIIGVSGGLDSTYALLVAIETCEILTIPREKILAVTMPGFGTSEQTHSNIIQLCQNFNVNLKEIIRAN